MKIIDKFKAQSKIMQILDVIFIICLVYDIILMMFNMNLNMPLNTLMLFIICITAISNLKR